MGRLIDDRHPVVSFLLWLLLAAFVVACFREVGVYGPTLIDHSGHAISLILNGAIEGFSHLASAVGVEFAQGIVAAIGVPIGVVAIVTIYRFAPNSKQMRRAWLVAVGFFLYPIFVDFLQDELPKSLLGGIPGAKIAIAIVFATIFLAATVLYEKSTGLGKWVAGALYLTPLFIMIGYLLRYESPTDIRSFFSHLSAAQGLGLCGLMFTAGFGIYLSRTHSV